MKEHSKDFPDELKQQLDQFEVQVPEFDPKSKRLERLAEWIYSPVKDPFELFHIHLNSFAKLIYVPILLILILFCGPFFFI